MNDAEQRALNFVRAIKDADDHPTCWFCARRKLPGAHHHYGDGCPQTDVPASPSWKTEKAS